MDKYYQLRFFIIIALLTIISVILSVVVIATMGPQVAQILKQVHFQEEDIAGIRTETSNESKVYTVIRVVDGDTFWIDYDGIEEKVRLIGIDAPESKDPHTPKECFSQEASEYLKRLIDQKEIRILGDSAQADRDRYGRLLRYAWVDDVFINEQLIQEGYAFEYTYNIPYQYQDVFKEAQEFAKSREVGLWSEKCK